MSAVLATLASLKSKLWLYAIIGGGVAIAAASVAFKLFTAGADSEKLKQAQETVAQHKKVQRIEADIDSLSAAAARKRLRDKWSQR